MEEVKKRQDELQDEAVAEEAKVEESAVELVPVLEQEELEQQTSQGITATAEETAKPKNTGLKVAIIFLIAAIVALLALVGVYAVSMIQANGVISEAVELAKQENYEAALATLDELSSEKQYKKGLDELQVVLDEQLEEAIDDEDYVAVYTLLAHADWHPDYEDLSQENNEALSETIAALMDEGDYVSAVKTLKKVSAHPNYNDIREIITAESWIWTCINNLKPVMKNPRSLQINSVEIYVPYTDGEYPSIILCESGQNGFGGYATSYTIYDDDDLSLMGSTSSLSDPDDYSEMLTVMLIESYRKETEIKYEYDLNRINKLLADGVTVKPDLQKYELGSYKNT